MGSARKVRLLVEYKGQLLRVCKLLFTATDASIYLIPYAPHRRFFYGRHALPTQEVPVDLCFSEDTDVDHEPKLSIHESGQVHVQVAGLRVGPLETCPLADLRGQHVATVSPDRFDGLPPFEGRLSRLASDRDLVHRVPRAVESGRFAIYVNGVDRLFADGQCWFTVTCHRATLVRPLYVGVKVHWQLPTGEESHPGITVLAGWDPRLPEKTRQDFVYVRGV
jgi:hypothetical protein